MRELQFIKAIRDLEYTKIGLFLSNQQFVEGNLVAVQQDYLVLDINEDVHYIPLEHIKALSKDATNYRETPQKVSFVERQSFSELLDVFKNSWCTINYSEKDSHVGVLSKVAEDHLILIKHAQLLYIPISCISTIHSKLPKHQILLANQQLAPTIQETQVTPVKAVEMDIQLPFIQEVHRQLELVPQLLEFLIARELPSTENNSELQTVEYEIKQVDAVQQLETAEVPKLINEEETAQQEVEDLIDITTIVMKESPDRHDEGILLDVQELPVIETFYLEESPVVVDEELVVALEESPVVASDELIVVVEEKAIIQDEQLVEVMVLEPIESEVRVENVPLEVSLHTDDSLESVVEDEEYSSEFDDWGDIESVFSTRKVKMEMLSFSDPLGYERDFPLSSWATFQKEKQTATNQNEKANDMISFSANEQPIPLNDAPKPIDVLKSPVVEKPSMKESKTDDGVIVEESQPATPTNASFTIIKMSLQDEKAMLEEQYFSLAKHAAKISQRTSRKQSAENSSKGNVTVDGQFISLMNHAAKMYQQLLDK